MKSLLVFLCLCTLCTCTPTVTIDEGILAGTEYPLPNGQVATVFFGVPYATPPLYEYRFKAPEKVKPWKGVYNASTLPSKCMQYEDTFYEVIGDEDCLYLNVFTPKLPSKNDNKLFDVLVYIHGGGFMFGNGQSMRPDYIMKENDIVFVSLNYRLGILGFMSTGDTVVPGNNGLKDQVLALKWVKKNIQKFGGNPDSITLVGSSAGGASVHYHYMSKASDGLFHRGISFSGSVLPVWTLPRSNTEKSIHVAAMAGCPTSNHEAMLTCLRQRPGRQIVELMRHFTVWQFEPFTTFGPTVEPANPNSFLTEQPINLLNRGEIKDLPWLVSLCTEEGLFRTAEFVPDKNILRELDEKWYELAPHMLFYNFTIPCDVQKRKVSAAIRKYYFGDKSISQDTAKELIQVYGDRAFYNEITRAIKIQASVKQPNVHCYKFAYRGKYSISNLYSKNFDDYGVSHADDVQFVVTINHLGSSLETKSDAAMTDLMGDMIKNFMKTGNAEVEGVNWEPVSKNKNDKLRCLEIRDVDELKMVEYEDTRTMKFWADLIPEDFSEIPDRLKEEL